jgi:integrase
MTMQDHLNPVAARPNRMPWNKGKLIGAKPPLRPKHVWSIRTKLQIAKRTRDLAMFNLAIDSKLRGCDVVALKVEDIAPKGYSIDRAAVRQKKTGQPVKFELTEQTRQAVDDYIKAARKKPGEFLFTGRYGTGALHVNEAIRAACLRMDCQHRARSESLRHPFAATNQGHPDLPAYG